MRSAFRDGLSRIDRPLSELTMAVYVCEYSLVANSKTTVRRTYFISY